MKHLVKSLTGWLLCIILAVGMLPMAGRKAKAEDIELWVESVSADWTYDGKEHTMRKYTVHYGNETTNGVEGQTEFTLSTGDKVTVSPNYNAKIRHVNENEVANSFTWTVANENNYTKGQDKVGTLIIFPAELTITMEDRELVFNDSTQYGWNSQDTGHELVEGLANGESLMIAYTPSSGKEVGSYLNGSYDIDTFYIKDGDEDVTNDYKLVSAKAGKLTILAPNPITITDDEYIIDMSKTYSDIRVDSSTGAGKTVVVTGNSTEHNLLIEVTNDEDFTVVFRNLSIDVSKRDSSAAVCIDGVGSVTIKLEGENAVDSGKYCAGVQKDSTGKLIISETENAGSLSATGGDHGAGIGGGNYEDASNINISGGTVTAIGGNQGAGIGGGFLGSGAVIEISGGEVTAIGGNQGAGIGGGLGGDGLDITISGGTVYSACKYLNGAGIGGGSSRNGDRITITGKAVVKASGGNSDDFAYGAAIGQGTQINGVISKGAESIITTITKESTRFDGEVWRYPAGTSVEEMADDVENKMDGAEQVKEATITFDSNNGETDERGLTPGKDTFPEDLFQNEGYAIASWNTDPNGSGDSYLPGDVVTFIGEITLYAQWAKLYNVTVKNCKATDETGKTIEQAIKGTTVTVTAATLDEGQAFVEWSCKDTPVTLENNSAPETTFVMPEGEVNVEAVIKQILVVDLKDSYEYHEGGVTPEFNVYFEGVDMLLQKDNEYALTFEDNDKPGTASITITISGPRKGSTTATFNITGNTVRWLDGDGSVLEEAYYTDAMGMPSYSKNITPTGVEQTGHIITFVGWDNGTVSSNEYGKVTEYKPLFSDEKITYKVAFVDEDGTELQSGEYAYGDMPKYNGEIPSGAPDVVCSAEFSGWDKEVVTVMGDEIYTATYKKYNEHDYQPIDGTAVAPTCTKTGKEADQKCSRCEAVITGKEIPATGHTFDQEVVDAKYLKSAADCITAAVYYKSCKCGEKSTDEKDIFTSGEPAGHKWKAATGYAPKTCEVCGLEEGQKVTYDPIKGQVFVWTKGSKEPFVLTIKRSQDDVNCFLHYLNTLLDGAEIKVEAKSGSTIITIPAETLEKLSVGEHKITVVFDDWKADFALSIAEAVATPTPAVDATPVTGDTMPVVPIAVVMVAAMAIAFAVRKNKQSAE